MNKIILTIVYVSLAILAVVAGLLIADAKTWSYWAAGACGVFWVLSMTLSVCPVAPAARIAGTGFQAISFIVACGLLVPYARTGAPGWLLGAVALVLANLVVTAVIALVLRPNVEH